MSKKELAALFAAVVLLSANAAVAQSSDDLKFCSGLRSSKERLACYDAAARIERSLPRQRAANPAPVTLLAVDAQARIAPPVERPQSAPLRRFGGFYAAATGGYEFAMRSPHPMNLGPLVSVPVDSLQGAKIGGQVGYNIEITNLVVGFEARGVYSFASRWEQASIGSENKSLPVLVGGCSGCGPITVSNVLLSNALTHRTDVERDLLFDVSVRAGVAVDDWLFYARAGLGAERSITTNRNDASGTKLCVNPTIVSQTNGFATSHYATSCRSISSGPVTTTKTTWFNPVLTTALGIEANVSPSWFVRAEVEMQHHYNSGAVIYTPAAYGSVGYRF